MKIMKRTVLLCAMLAPVVSLAGTKDAAKLAFEKMKTLVGKWSGTMGSGKDAMPATVEYRLTGSGSALVETLGAGSPYEMISVYHLDGNDLVMTHYCGAGNQPSMKLKSGKDGNVLFFDFYRGSNMKLTDMHMHSVTFKFDGKDHVVANWVSCANGKPGEPAAFDFHRVK